MKTYWISKKHLRSGVIGIIIGITFLSLGLYTTVSSGKIGAESIFTGYGLFCCVIAVYLLLFTFRGGKYSVDKTGIIMHIGCKHWVLHWDEIQEYDMWGIRKGGLTLWIYFSSRHLEEGEWLSVFSRRWDDLEKTAFFQYSAKDLHEILDVFPPEISCFLQDKQERLNQSLSLLEKLRHR